MATAPARAGDPTVPRHVPGTASGIPTPASGLAARLASRLAGWHPALAAAVVGVAGFVPLFLLSLLGGVLVRDVLSGSVVGDWDSEISRWFADRRTPALNTASYIGSQLAGIWEVPVGMAIAVGALFLLRHWRWGGVLLIGITLEGALYASITYVFSRERPAVPRLEDLIHNDSFPSGHTAAAMVMYGGIALVVAAATRKRAWRALAWSAAVLVPPFVAWSRIYRGMHFMTDTFVGVLIGLGCLVVAMFATHVGGLVAERRGASRREVAT